MRRGINLFSVLGIRVSLDYTWFIVFVLVAWSLGYGYYPLHYPTLEPPVSITLGVISAVLLFACVLIHELSHSYTSNRLGIEIKEITLFIFGGVARLTEEPNDAIKELKIAVAGPLASLVLAVLFKVLYLATENAGILPLSALFEFLYIINIVLLVFNMIPGFPLDGGRVLRAIWWASTGNVIRATKITSTIGKGFALVLIVFGFIEIFGGFFIQGLWAILIGTFLMQASEASYRQLLMKATLEDVKVGDIMSTGVVTVDAALTLQRVIDEYFFHYHFVSFPVSDGQRIVGMLSLNDVRVIPREKWVEVTVREAMKPLPSGRSELHPQDLVTEAFTRMLEEGAGRYPVVDEGRLVGIISRRDIMKTMELKTELVA